MRLRNILTIFTATALGACAPVEEDDGAANADAVVVAPDATDEAAAMAPYFNPAVVTASHNVYALSRRQTALIGSVAKAECTLQRTSGWREELVIPEGTKFLIRNVYAARGGAQTATRNKVGIMGALYERRDDGSAGASAALQLFCLGHEDGYVPTREDIAATFEVPGGIGFDLAYSKPTTTR